MSNHEQLVSIIMPTYNRAEYIRETINSIQKQTYTNWELLIMDDGSTDNTGAIIESLGDNRVQFHKLERTGIINKVKSEGLALAKGELIAFMDSDDLWHPEKTEKQVSAIQSHPDVAISLTGGFNFKDNPTTPIEYYYKQKSGSKKGNLFVPYCKGEVSAYIQVLMARKQCFDTIAIYTQDYNISDRKLIGQLAYNYKGILLYEPLFFRRLHESNFSTNNILNFRDELINELTEYKKKKMLPKKLANQLLFKSCLEFSENAMKNKKWQFSFDSIIRAWHYNLFSIIPAKKLLKLLYSIVVS